VAKQKTEVVCFPGRKRLQRPVVLDIGGTSVEAKPTMKYLGVILDGRLSFRHHLEHLKGKVGAVSRALSRIMPNLRGPREKDGSSMQM